MIYEPGSVTTRETIDRGIINEYGSRLLQLTAGPFVSTNIYSELCYGDASGRYFVYNRHGGEAAGVWRYDFETGESTVFLTRGAFGKTVSNDQKYYWSVSWTGRDEATITRRDIVTFETEAFRVHCPKAWLPSAANAPVSEDGRYMVLLCHPAEEDRRFIVLLDMVTGEAEIAADRYGVELCNPHLIIDPSGSGDILVQINRGVKMGPDGKLVSIFEPYGPRLDIFNVYDRSVRETKAGYPYCPALGGHSCWIGKTGRFMTNVFTVDLEQLAQGGVISAIGYYADMERRERAPGIVPNYYPAHLEVTQKVGSLCVVDRIENEPRLYGQGYYCGHPNASRDGKYFCADVLGQSVLIVGSFKTGRTYEIMHDVASLGGSISTQPTPYFMPGNKWIIFSSDRTGISQVYALSVPEKLLAELDAD